MPYEEVTRLVAVNEVVLIPLFALRRPFTVRAPASVSLLVTVRLVHERGPNDPVPVQARVEDVTPPVHPKDGTFTAPVKVGLANGANVASVLARLVPVGPYDRSDADTVPATLMLPRRLNPNPLAPPTQTVSPYALQDPTAWVEPPIRTVSVCPDALNVLNRHVA